MDPTKRMKLHADGWKVGTVQELLDLSDAEVLLIDMHVRLVDEIRRRLSAQRISQVALARELGTSASRLSNMLAGREVSADALVRALFVLGATSRDVGRVMGGEAKKQRKRAT